MEWIVVGEIPTFSKDDSPLFLVLNQPILGPTKTE